MKVLILTFLFVIYHINIEVTAFMTPNDIRHHLGSRSPYRFKSNKNDTRIKYPGCKDIKIWMMIRHGTRLPDGEDMSKQDTLRAVRNEILLQHSNGRGQLTNDQLKQLEQWTSSYTIDQEHFLALEGQDEMILLAERMQKRFPNAIKHKYHNGTFLFRHTPTQRTHQSARYFALGLFDKKNAQNVIFSPAMKVDKVLRFYKYCDRWQKQVKKNPETYKEQGLYGISQEMNKTLEFVSKKLGLDRVLKLDTVAAMYKYCGYETAWDKHHLSPWCYAFDDKTIKTMEYYYDLKTYWLDGYGHELTYRPACVSINHMFDSFRLEDSPRATFLFTHSGTILKLLTYFGLYKPDSPLTARNEAEDRKWRTSDIDPFAANLAFVLFKCKDGPRVLTLHQENIIRLPMCSEDLCPLKTLMNFFHDSTSNCNFEEMCSLDDGEGDATTQVNTSFNMTIDTNTTNLID